jgi:threonine dehydrogenase-like Zn-dependent dehydrogenase
MVCPARVCVPLPDELSFDEGAMIACGTSTAYLALTRMDLSGRDTVAIFGQGPVGVAGTMLAKAMGCRVIAIDISDARLDLAKQAGADEVVNGSDGTTVDQVLDLTGGEGADASLEAVGATLTRQQSAQCVRLFGRSALVGERGQAIYEATPDIIHRHLAIYGSWTVSTFGMEETAQFAVDRKISLGDLISDRITVPEVPDAYARFDKQDTGKMCIVWD